MIILSKLLIFDGMLDRLAEASRAASAPKRHDADFWTNARDLPAFLDITNPLIPFGIYV